MFKGYKIVVTGATSGIGLATTKKFLDNGATVIGIGRNFKKVKDLGPNFIPCKCDISIPQKVEKACTFISDTFGGELDTFVHCACHGTIATVKDFDVDVYQSGMDLTLVARRQIISAAQLFCKRKPPIASEVFAYKNFLLLPEILTGAGEGERISISLFRLK